MDRRKLIIGAVIGFVVILLLIVTLAISGGNKNKKNQKSKVGSGNITLTYWRVFDDKETFDPIIADYQKEHPNIKIEYKKLDYADYEKKLLEALAAGRGPDLFSIGNAWVPKYQDKITAMPDDMLSVDEYNRTFFKVAAQDNVIDNKIYGLPYAIDSLGLFVNTTLTGRAELYDPPQTWEDLVGKGGCVAGKPVDPAKPGMLAKLNNRQGNTFNQSAIALGTGNVSRSADILALMMLQQRTTMVNDNHDQATYNLTQKVEGKDIHLGTEALKFYTSFADPGNPCYAWNAQQGDAVSAFAQGKTAMLLGYSYTVQALTRLNPNLTYSVYPAPQIGGQDPVNYASYLTEVVAKRSQHQTEAWDFIRFAADKSHLDDYLDKAQRVSSRKDISTGGNVAAIYKQNETAVSWYKGEYLQADPIFVGMINQVVGGEDPQRAIDAAANQQTNVLRELKGSGS